MSDSKQSPGLMARLRAGLSRTRERLGGGIGDLLLGRAKPDAATLEALETTLLMADAGVEATRQLIDGLQQRLSRRELLDGAALLAALRSDMIALLKPCQAPLELPTANPAVVLMVGVNGSGKTTSCGKLAAQLQASGLQVMMAAGDTFRAAAIEQLQGWGERIGVPVVAQQPGADSAAVIYDALQAARSRGFQVLLADTSGRLHTQGGLMDELRKVRRVVNRFDDQAPHEILLVLDATNGQNALVQAREFHAAVGVTGLIVTKLDGTARGGIVLAIARQLGLPVRFIGCGEQVGDLRPFDATAFVDALISPVATGEHPGGSPDNQAA